MKASKIGKKNGDTQFVLCKKSIRTFKKGEWYPISGMYGDPQAAFEAGFEYMTTEFLNVILVMDNYPGKEFYFEWKGKKVHYATYENEGFFQEHFIVDIKEERKKKLEKIENKN